MSSSQGVAVITGSSQGIGKAIALRLADDGFDILLNDLASESQFLQEVKDTITNKGKRCVIYTADVSVESEVIGMMKFVVEELGGIDVMVANAGVGSLGSIVDVTVEEWERVFSVNARGVFLCYKHAAKRMIEQGRGGRIMGASSMYGKRGEPSTGTYCATKFAVRGLTHSAAAELGKYGITVNAYAPVIINTAIVLKAGGEEASAAFFKREIADTAVGRAGQPEEVANVVSFLASKASGFITGQAISVNGGSRVMD
ncbi:acetoin reductase family protein [Cyathus striatus]|nr:acetoin reductase family protein [Cyathus striatus]